MVSIFQSMEVELVKLHLFRPSLVWGKHVIMRQIILLWCCKVYYFHPTPQTELQVAKKALEEQKAVLRERNKELQKYEQEKKKLEKEKVECSLKIKDLEHNISKLNKNSHDAARRVGVL